ncbi:MAG: hypothetical protein NZ455_05630 [Bacteroidia bacterium]|nr:hypothetical protein [Bacteroidia bacterium]MDW8346271.1 hypothetical protein [Bacteroidia bacterium]
MSKKHVFGRYTNGEWKSPLKYSGKYKVYRREIMIGSVTIKPLSNKSEEPCSPDFSYSERFENTDNIDYIAVEGTWNHLPRSPKKINTKDPKHRNTVIEWGKKNKLHLTDFQIVEAVQIDIDNDQTDEVIIVAKNIEHTFGAVENNFSAVLLVKNNYTHEVASFFLDSQAAKNCTDETPCYASIYRLVMCLDINNDGVLEIITEDIVHEGIGKSIYQWKQGKFERVLDWGCGV